MATSSEVRMAITGVSIICLPLLFHGVSSGLAREVVPARSWGYRRFHANDSLIGQRIPCTHEEKLCLTYNLLYSSLGDSCAPLSFNRYADRKEFLYGSGKLSVRNNQKKQFFGLERMAYDGVYYKDTVVRDVLCGCNETLSPHIFGGAECRCVPPEPMHVEQPPEEGRCIVPDLRFPNIQREHFFHSRYDDLQGFKADQIQPADISPPKLRLQCSPQQQECFSRRELWFEGACFPLLEQGPCPKEHLVALDARAAADGYVNTTCVHERGGCPPGHVLAAFDDACHSEDDLRLIVPGRMHRNQFGVHVAIRKYVLELIFGLMVDKMPGTEYACIITILGRFDGMTYGIPTARPICGVDDFGECALHEIRAEPPLPELKK